MTYKFRTRDIARLSGNTVQSVRRHKKDRRFNPNDLLSLCRYILSWKFINDGRPKKEVK